jgi:hypothetical protein
MPVVTLLPIDPDGKGKALLNEVAGYVLKPTERRETELLYYFHEWNWKIAIEHLLAGLDKLRPDGWEELVELRVPPDQTEYPLPPRPEV